MFRIKSPDDTTILKLKGQIVRQISFVPETMLASKLMKLLMQQKRSLAIVVDEFGGTSGIVTLEDVLEEIVGEINDEYDEDEKSYQRINSNTYVFEGKTLLADFYKILNLDDDIFAGVEGDADTIAGLLLEIKGDFPKLHEKIEYSNFTFEIQEMDVRRISKVKVVVHDYQPTSDQPTA
jgi:CBS domain containing-hemolysin-like protein